MDQKINVGLVEDQFLFREGMKAILAAWKNIEVIFESPEGYTVINKLKGSDTLPDVMLVDLSLPPHENREYSGREVIVALQQHFPSIKTIILSGYDDENFIAQMIEHGANGYLIKDCNPEEVYEAICSVYSRGSYINERALKAIQKNLGKKEKIRPSQQGAAHLTKREEEVLQLVCQQLTAEEIAEKLFISVKTVNGHRTNLLEKTGASNVAGLVIYAIKNKLVSI